MSSILTWLADRVRATRTRTDYSKKLENLGPVWTRTKQSLKIWDRAGPGSRKIWKSRTGRVQDQQKFEILGPSRTRRTGPWTWQSVVKRSNDENHELSENLESVGL